MPAKEIIINGERFVMTMKPFVEEANSFHKMVFDDGTTKQCSYCNEIVPCKFMVLSDFWKELIKENEK